MAARSYTDDEVESILRRAIERQQAEADGLGHDELVAAAREIGLDDAAVDRAIKEVEREQGERSLVAEVRAQKRGRFLRHLFTYLTLVAGFVGLHFVGLLGAWVWWVVFGWGAALLLAAPRAFRDPNEDEIEKAEHRRNRKERRRLAAEQRRAAHEAQRERVRQRRMGVKSPMETEIERVVEEGVSLLLRAAANKLAQTEIPAPRPGQGDFGKYVAKKETGTSAPAAGKPAAAPKVRVEESEAREEQVAERAPRRDAERARK